MFTSWSDLLNQLKQDLASGVFRTTAAYSVLGDSVSYRTVDEFFKIYNFVEQKAAAETKAYAGRLSGRPARGGC